MSKTRYKNYCEESRTERCFRCVHYKSVLLDMFQYYRVGVKGNLIVVSKCDLGKDPINVFVTFTAFSCRYISLKCSVRLKGNFFQW